MKESDKGHLSASLQDFFKTTGEIINGNCTAIQYLNTAIVIPTASTETLNDDPYNGFTRMKDNPNDGMVIVQMDDGGPRMRRTKATEIVIPLDPVSSSESIDTISDGSRDSTISSKSSTNLDEPSAVQLNDFNINECSSADKTNGYSSPTKPAKTCCTTPSDMEPEPEFGDSESDRSKHSRARSAAEHLDSDSAQEDIESNCDEAAGEVTDSDNDETDSEDSADEKRRESFSESSSSDSTRCNSDVMSRESFLNVCREFKHGTAELEEVVEASYPLGGRILQSQQHHHPSNSIALRMYSSLSANYKLRNTGYVDLDSQLVRPNSATLESVINRFTPVIGDTIEMNHSHLRPIPVDETPTENESSSPVCSTRFDFTPAARSKIEGVITACSDRMNGVRSLESGRKNPQAKQDNEIRCTKAKEMPFTDLQLRKPRHVLPPISKATDVYEAMLNNTKHLAMPKSAVKQTKLTHTRKQRTNVKPGIPHQLRSIACYQEGKVEVSIMGDKRLIPESEPLNVNITFVHRQDSLPSKRVKVIDVADDKKETFKTRRFPSPKNTRQPDETLTNVKKSLPALKIPPRLCKNRYEQQHTLGIVSSKNIISAQRHTIPRRKTLPPLRNVPEEMKKSIKNSKRKAEDIGKRKQNKKLSFNRKLDQSNWDIVNKRAQWPPFNTHINQEASERHQKMFTDISV